MKDNNNIGDGVKNDTGKIRYDLIPPDSLHELAKLYTTGADKYGDRNWEKGMSWSRIFGAMMRHSWAWFSGERLDPEDGQPHLASVAWCALALLSYEMRGIGDDTRPCKTGTSREEILIELNLIERGIEILVKSARYSSAPLEYLTQDPQYDADLSQAIMESHIEVGRAVLERLRELRLKI